LIGYWIWCAGAIGELLALQVLYQGHEKNGSRIIVFLATALLVRAVATGPLRAYMDVRSAMREQGHRLPDNPPEIGTNTPEGVSDLSSDDAGKDDSVPGIRAARLAKLD
jgi:hypothetical protein